MCCDGLRSRLRAIKLLLCLQGCCSYYIVKLRTNILDSIFLFDPTFELKDL